MFFDPAVLRSLGTLHGRGSCGEALFSSSLDPDDIHLLRWGNISSSYPDQADEIASKCTSSRQIMIHQFLSFFLAHRLIKPKRLS